MTFKYRGASRKIGDLDLPRIGHRIGVGEDEIHALIEVEAAGSGFDSQGRVKALYEPHIAYKYSSGGTRQMLVSAGLAYPNWKRDYPKDSYSRILQAAEIDQTVALKATSWGLGQIMGFNHRDAGYVSPEAMVAAFADSEAAQLEAMIDFIIANKLDDELRRHDWRGFARGYNGEGYEANGYHIKLAASYLKWSRIKDTPWTPGQAPQPAPAPLPPPPDIEPVTPAPVPAPAEKPGFLARFFAALAKALKG